MTYYLDLPFSRYYYPVNKVSYETETDKSGKTVKKPQLYLQNAELIFATIAEDYANPATKEQAVINLKTLYTARAVDVNFSLDCGHQFLGLCLVTLKKHDFIAKILNKNALKYFERQFFCFSEANLLKYAKFRAKYDAAKAASEAKFEALVYAAQ